jgi:phenylacetate-CoA ligase
MLREAWYVAPTLLRQYGSGMGLRRLQLRQVNRLLAFCRQRVPYYRADPRYPDHPLRSLEELTALPILAKQAVRERNDQFVADGVNPRRCVMFHTSGTTGQRMRVLHDRSSYDYMRAGNVRRFFSTGRYTPASRLTNIRFFQPPRRALERVGLFRQHFVSSERPMAEVKRELLGNRPHVLMGYPTHLRELLRSLGEDERRQLRRTLRMVMTDSELLAPASRRALTEGFGVPVFDEYGAWELLNIYYECRRGGRHIAEDRILVEVVGDDGDPVPDGTEGWVVATHLRERAMPLVRYWLGDAGLIEPGRCPCGRRFRTMRLTRGRENDNITLPGGKRLWSQTFLGIAERHPGVAECFVRQDRDGSIRVHVVPTDRSADGTAAVLNSVRAHLFEVAGSPFPLEVVPADRVPLTVGGKGRFVESDYAGP